MLLNRFSYDQETLHTFNQEWQLLGNDWVHSVEIRSRIEQVRTTFMRMKEVFCKHNLNMDMKMRMVRCYICLSVLLYRMESWALTEATIKRLEPFEMWIYQRMLKITWLYHVTIAEVMCRMNKEQKVINTVKKRKLSYSAT